MFCECVFVCLGLSETRNEKEQGRKENEQARLSYVGGILKLERVEVVPGHHDGSHIGACFWSSIAIELDTMARRWACPT